jgi:hypothetical protein
MREMVGKAIRWWEPRRLIYNGVLAIYVLIRFYLNYPASKSALHYEVFLALFGLAVLANVAYCAPYLPDLFVQYGEHTEWLPKIRLTLLGVGTCFAIVLTHFWTSALLMGGNF